jgi:diguanylate cyclase (GGDEF)-like protein/PAS domain S-box-containing protein
MALSAHRGSWSLKTKLALSSGLLMCAISVASTGWVLHNVEKDARAAVTGAQTVLVRSAATDLDEKLALRRDAILTIAPLLAAASPTTGSEISAFFAPRPVLRKMFDDVMVADAAGNVVHVGAPDAPRDDDAVGDRSYFKQILAGASFVVSPPMRSKESGDPFIVFAAPLRSQDGTVKGALIGSLNLTRPNVISALGKQAAGETGYFVLIDAREGAMPVILMHPEAGRIMEPTPGGPHDPLIEHALRGEEVNATSTNSHGVETLRNFKRIQGAPWVLVAVYPTRQAFAELEVRRAQALWIGGAMFVVAWLLAWLISNWLLLPLGRLKDVMERHASDPGQPLTAMEMGSSELAALVIAYNTQAAARQVFQSRLEASERHMKDITDNLPVLISYIDKDQRCVFVNATLAYWFGVDPADAIGKKVREMMGFRRSAELAGPMQRCIAGERVSFEMEVETLQGPRILDNAFVPDRGPGGKVAGFYALSNDVTELKAVQGQLDALVRTDALTGLANRYQFDRILPLALARCASAGSDIAVMFLDVDHFKAINDTHGHAAGDETLREVARRVRDCVRTTDTVARLGGDEFVVILEAPGSVAVVKEIAGKIVDAIAKPFSIEGRSLIVTVSIGVAFGGNAELQCRDAVAVADAALYRAKSTGRGRYCIDPIAPVSESALAA